MARDLSGMSFGTTSVQPENKERSTGEILADAGIGMLRGAASGKGILGILAGGALGAIEGDVAAEREKRMADLAEQKAKLQNDTLQQNMEHAEKNDKRSQELLKLRKAEFESGVEDRKWRRKKAEEATEYQKKRDAENDAWRAKQEEYQRERDAKNDALRERQEKENSANRRKQGEILSLQLQAAQDKADQAAYEQEKKQFDSLMNATYGSQLDFEGQSVLKSSVGYQQAQELYVIFKLYDSNPEMAQRLMKQGGWSVVPRSGTNGEGYDIINDNTGAKFGFDETNMKALQEDIQKNFQNGYMAAMALGTPANSLQQVALRSMLQSTESQELYGTRFDAAYAGYQTFVQTGLKSGQFTDRDVATHVLNRTLQAAVKDGKLNDDEIAALVPQFQMYLQKFGGEIIPGADLKTTTVRMKDGTTITLDTLAEQLQQRDVIGARYQLHLANMIGQRKAQESKALEESLKREKQRLEVEKLKNEVGDKKKVNEIDSPEAEFEDKEVSKLVSFGRDNAAKFNVDLPNDVQAANFGMGLVAAKNAYSKYGLNYDAHMGYRSVTLRLGNQMPIKRKDGQPLFLSIPALKADLQTITLLQQKAKESLASNDISSAQREQIEKTLKELSQKEEAIKLFLSNVSDLERYANEKQIERDLKNDTTTYFTPFSPVLVLPPVPKDKKGVQREAEKYKKDLMNGNGYVRLM